MANEEALIRGIAANLLPFTGAPGDFEPLIELAKDATCVLLGEATHGTHEFYRYRAELTKRLLAEHGFAAVAAEADWPDAYRVHRWVRGLGSDADAEEALRDFRRFPPWLWRNADVLDFVGWLRDFNDERAPDEKIGFYGLDLYSLHASMAAVLAYLDKLDRGAAERARARYSCFDHFGAEPERYAYATSLGLVADCEREAVMQLLDLQRQRERVLRTNGLAAEDEFFQAEQNARVVRNAEEYYRLMLGGRVSTWNLRDEHMADTLEALLVHLGKRFSKPKVIVWAHNSHVGDASATELGVQGEIALGQLVRRRYPGHCVLIGFTTSTGTVTAAPDWGRPARRMRVRTPLPDSVEDVFHRVGERGFLLRLGEVHGELSELLAEPRLERAIGVVYKPEMERVSHYFEVRLARQFDAVVHIDVTRALEPLERSAAWRRGEEPETFPTGL